MKTNIPRTIIPASLDGNSIAEVIVTDPNASDGGMVIRDVRGNPNNPTYISSDVYVQSDIDSGATTYTGYVNSAGNWYIKKADSTSTRYCAGSDTYPTNWSNRAALTYVYYYELF